MQEVHIDAPLGVSMLDERVHSTKPIPELMQIIGDSKNTIPVEELEKLIADFVVKYLMMYLLGIPADKVVPLEHVNKFFGWICAVMNTTRTLGKCKITYPENIGYFIHSYKQVVNAATLIADVASTTAIIRDIVMLNLEQRSGKPYIGFDLGTGSGILMLAMRIQAMRNGFGNDVLIGFDNDASSLSRASKIFQILGQGNVLFAQADSTKPDTYTHFKEHGLPAFICNETLPVQSAPFYTPGYPSEPFFQNHYAIRSVFGPEIYHATGHFPHRVDVLLSDGGDRKADISATPGEEYQLRVFGNQPDEVLCFVSPEKVQNTSGSELVRLEQVGDELRQKTWDTENPRRIVPANSVARFRWSSPKVLDKQF